MAKIRKIYLLEKIDGGNFDTMDSCVIRAESEKEARKIAADSETDYGRRDDWLEKAKTTCKVIRLDRKSELIHRDVNWA